MTVRRVSWFHLVAAVLAVASVFLVVRALVADWDEVTDAVGDADLLPLLVAPAVALAAMTVIAAVWYDVLGALGFAQLRRWQVVSRYYVGELAKYVPGGIWSVLGRSELLVREGVARRTAYASTVLSLVLMCLSAVMLGGVLTIVTLLSGRPSHPLMLLALPGPLGVLILHPSVGNRVLAVVDRVRPVPDGVELPGIGTSLLLIVRYAFGWALVAGATVLVAEGIADDVSPLQVAVASLLGWFAGFVIVPVPGGVGVREAVFLALCGLSGGVAAGTAVAARFMFVLVDALGALVSAPSVRRRRTQTVVAPRPSSTGTDA